MSQGDDQVKKNKVDKNVGPEITLKNFVAIECGWLWTLADLLVRAVVTAAPAAGLALAIFGSGVIVGNISPVPANVLKPEISGIGAAIWLIFFVASITIWHQSLGRYWRRNVVGYTLWIWRCQGCIYSKILYGSQKHPNIDSRFDSVAIPLGGWLVVGFWPAMKRENYAWSGWDMKFYALTNSEQAAKVILRDEFGSRVKMEAIAAFRLALAYPDLPTVIDYHLRHENERPEIIAERETLRQQLGKVVQTVVVAVDEILNTSRLYKSKEAQAIRQKLAEDTIAALQPHDVRAKRLAELLKQKHQSKRQKQPPVTSGQKCDQRGDRHA